ncbi:hypothetical protein ACQP00_19460 [Dactylosporangium sp. CS-047395]|uniref:hypothetical protein n=1 Tax=Dactylosporangium sp. CS-047395 TaxID=3239936 RepID=UPI003D90E38C
MDCRDRYRRLLAMWDGGPSCIPGFEDCEVVLPPPGFPGLAPALLLPDEKGGSVSLEWALAPIIAGSKMRAEALARTAAAFAEAE